MKVQFFVYINFFVFGFKLKVNKIGLKHIIYTIKCSLVLCSPEVRVLQYVFGSGSWFRVTTNHLHHKMISSCVSWKQNNNLNCTEANEIPHVLSIMRKHRHNILTKRTYLIINLRIWGFCVVQSRQCIYISQKFMFYIHISRTYFCISDTFTCIWR